MPHATFGSTAAAGRVGLYASPRSSSLMSSKAVVVPAKRARIHSKEEQLVAHSLLGLTGPVAVSPAPLPAPLARKTLSTPLNFSFNLVPMAR